jgi:small subunit ribosomal protein S6
MTVNAQHRILPLGEGAALPSFNHAAAAPFSSPNNHRRRLSGFRQILKLRVFAIPAPTSRVGVYRFIHPWGRHMADLNTYELTYIINAAISDNQIQELVERVNKFITENGGEILEVDAWGNQRLSYPINKKRNGYYVNLYFKAQGEMIIRLERAMEINENLLRYLTLRMDAKMIRHFEQRQTAKKSEPAEA